VGDWVHFSDRPGIAFKYKWEQTSGLPVVRKKPTPLWDHLLPKWTDRGDIMAALLNQPSQFAGYLAVSTPYGTWHYTARMPQGAITRLVEREFKPIKRMKPYLHEVFGKCPNLPVERPDLQGGTPYDGRLPLEKMTIIEDNRSGVKMFKYGWMCPVCGIIEDVKVWNGWEQRCAFCQIQFLVPETTGEGS
jgi:hypothetical protein